MPAKAQAVLNPFDAARTIYDALEPLDATTRVRVLTSALSLLGMDSQLPANAPTPQVQVGGSAPPVAPVTPRHASGDRPLSPVELIQQKQPSTNAQRLAVFAYYREKYEGMPRFSRADLKTYFAKARLQPPQNYDRDFINAVQLGYLYEDGAESYITSKGVEAVEAGFDGKQPPRGRSTAKKKAGKRSARK
jgi:hypothetical protein